MSAPDAGVGALAAASTRLGPLAGGTLTAHLAVGPCRLPRGLLGPRSPDTLLARLVGRQVNSEAVIRGSLHTDFPEESVFFSLFFPGFLLFTLYPPIIDLFGMRRTCVSFYLNSELSTP